MDYIKNMDEDTCVYATAIPAWVTRMERDYIRRQLHNLRNSGMKVYF